MAWEGSRRQQRLPSNWKKLRAWVLKRDNHECYLCGKAATEVDHIRPGDDHSTSNLASICWSCHKKKSSGEGGAARVKRRREIHERLRRNPEDHPLDM